MMEVYLNFYTICVRVFTNDESFRRIVKDVADDFSYFLFSRTAPVCPAPTCDIEIELKRASPDALPERGRFLFRNRACAVYGWNQTRFCDYGQGAAVVATIADGCRKFEIFSESADGAHELAHLALLSSVGELLDGKKFHRVHALGLETGGAASLVVLPSGGGKSALATLALKNPSIRIFSDETPLLRGNELFALPMRMALRREVAEALKIEPSGRTFVRRRYPTKDLYFIPRERVSEPRPLSRIIVGKRALGTSAKVRPCSRVRVFVALCESMVVGIGVAQIAEHMLRARSIGALARVAISRLATAIRVSWCADSYLFEFVEDARVNAQALIAALENASVPDSIARDKAFHPSSASADVLATARPDNHACARDHK